MASSTADEAGRGLPAWRRRLLLALLHPAGAGLPPRAWAVGRQRRAIALACRAGRARRVCFAAPGADGAVLDGLLLQPAAGRRRPILVTVVGNAMTYEMVVGEALRLADDFSLRVLLYNSRGIGRSLGRPLRPQDAIDDCRGALAWAAAQGAPVGLYGISLGAAWALRAAQQAAAAGELAAGELALVALVRAFASPRAVVAGHLGAGLADRLERDLRAAGFDTLDLAAALAAPLPARRVMITAARRDRLLPPAAGLAAALGLVADAEGRLPSGQPVLFVANHGAHHFDRNLQTPLHDEVLREVAGRPQQRP